MTKDANVSLAAKLAEAIARKGVKQADVARHFGVRPPTVSGTWLKLGQIDKRHYKELVSYFDLPFSWWFGDDTPVVRPSIPELALDPARTPLSVPDGPPGARSTIPVIGYIKAGPDGYYEEMGYAVGGSDKELDRHSPRSPRLRAAGQRRFHAPEVRARGLHCGRAEPRDAARQHRRREAAQRQEDAQETDVRA